jgi:futalosine hydrolase
MRPVLILVAVRQEAALLEQALTQASRCAAPAFPHVEGLIHSLPVAVCAAGVGKVNAAAACAALIERLRPHLVITTGCAGAYPGSGLGIGDLAVAGSEFLGDEGVVTSTGWLDLHDMKLPLLVRDGQRYYNEIPLPAPVVEQALHVAGSCGIPLACGPFVTVSTCSGSQQQGEALAGRFGALCENMEGAAVALTCLHYGIDCLEIRGISNLVEERNMAAWDIPRAVAAAQGFVLKYLEAGIGD